MSLNAPTPAAFVSPGSFVAGVIDTVATSRLFTVNSYTGATSTTAPTAATAGVPAAEAGLPTVQSVSMITAYDGVAGNVQQVGFVRLTLGPNAADTVNASSPMQLVLSPSALVLTATTSAG